MKYLLTLSLITHLWSLTMLETNWLPSFLFHISLPWTFYIHSNLFINIWTLDPNLKTKVTSLLQHWAYANMEYTVRPDQFLLGLGWGSVCSHNGSKQPMIQNTSDDGSQNSDIKNSTFLVFSVLPIVHAYDIRTNVNK